MDRPPRSLPIAPLLLSALLVAAGLYVVITRSGPPPGPGNAVRMVTWNVSPGPGAAISPDAIAAALADLDADVIALQGLTNEGQGQQVAAALGGSWHGETLAYQAGGLAEPASRYLAVLAGPRTRILAYHLVPAGPGDALALTLQCASGLVWRVVCLDAGNAASDVQIRDRYTDGVLTWCGLRPSALTVLAGAVDVGPETAARLGDSFINAASSPADVSELHIAPKTIRGVRASRVNHASVPGVAGSPLLVDLPFN